MAKGGGSGKTPERVVELLKNAVAEKGQSAVARESGLTQSAVHRYISGIGEPSTATLSKLARCFGNVTVAWLRGEDIHPLVLALSERYPDFDPEHHHKYVNMVEVPEEKEQKKWNTQQMIKFFKNLSLSDQEGVAFIARFFVDLDSARQNELKMAAMKFYYQVHKMPSNTEPMYDADGKAE